MASKGSVSRPSPRAEQDRLGLLPFEQLAKILPARCERMHARGLKDCSTGLTMEPKLDLNLCKSQKLLFEINHICL